MRSKIEKASISFRYNGAYSFKGATPLFLIGAKCFISIFFNKSVNFIYDNPIIKILWYKVFKLIIVHHETKL